MRVVDLDGHYTDWSLKGYIAKGKLQNKSSLHIQARDLLLELFPTLQVLEEVPISPRKSETLYLDFYLPLIKTCIETHGEQHFKFVPFYHNNMMNFIKSKKRDSDKKEWCEINNIKYIELFYNEPIDQWKAKITNE
jgi:hypothetical protein